MEMEIDRFEYNYPEYNYPVDNCAIKVRTTGMDVLHLMDQNGVIAP